MQQAKININIPNPKEVFNEAFMPFILQQKEARKPLAIFEGGRGSGKSQGVAQGLVLRAMSKKLRIALVRKVADTVRDSIYKEILDVVSGWDLGRFFDATVSPLAIKVSNGSEFICKGLDKSEKIKSIANVDVVCVEEATELTKEDWTTLALSIRGKKPGDDPKQKILIFNRQAGHWTEDTFFDSTGAFVDSAGVYHSHTTFQDNKFLDKPFLDDLEQMKVQDFDLYRKNALGLPVALKGLVYQNWDIEEFPESVQAVYYGLDFGFNDPIVLLRVGVTGNDIWVDEMYYERKRTTGDLLKVMPTMMNQYATIWADSAEADRIEEMRRAGWDVKGADKGKNSVRDGIDLLKRYRVHLTARSTNTRKDFENYSWKVDEKNPDKPMHAYSHSPDALRYPIWMTQRVGAPVKAQDVRMPVMESITVAELY